MHVIYIQNNRFTILFNLGMGYWIREMNNIPFNLGMGYWIRVMNIPFNLYIGMGYWILVMNNIPFYQKSIKNCR